MKEKKIIHTFDGWAFPLPLWHDVVLIDPGNELVSLEGCEQLVAAIGIDVGIVFGIVFVIFIVARTLRI